MIENGRDEDACPQMDALADEDHTHHLTLQEYYYYKSSWWVRLNKTGSDTVPVQRRPDFQTSMVFLAAIERKKQELKEISNGHRVHLLLLLLHGGVGWVFGGLLILMKVTTEMNQVLIEQGDLIFKYVEQLFKA